MTIEKILYIFLFIYIHIHVFIHIDKEAKLASYERTCIEMNKMRKKENK